MDEKAKGLAGRLFVALVVSLGTHNPVPMIVATGKEMVDSLARREGDAAKIIVRNLRRTYPNAEEDDVYVALINAEDAVTRADLGVADFVDCDFDASSLTTIIKANLDGGLSDKQRSLAIAAIELAIKRLAIEVDKNPTSVFLEYFKKVRQDLKSGFDEAQARTTVPSDPLAVARGLADARRLRDMTNRELFVGTLDREVVRRAQSRWHEEVRKGNEDLESLFPRPSPTENRALVELTSIKLDEPYPSISRALGTDAKQEAIRTLQGAIGRKTNNAAWSGQRRYLRWLSKQGRDPRFELAVPIVGSWGAGKSRLLDRVVESCLRDRLLPVFVDATAGGSLRDTVLDSIEAATGASTVTHVALRQDLSTRLPVVVLIDDWDVALRRDPRRMDELEALIPEMSDIQVRWIVCADEAAIPRIHAGGGDDFWRRYGAIAEGDFGKWITTGWFELDRYNEDLGIGLQILEECLDDPPPELALIRDHAVGTTAVLRQLSRPLLALLRLDSQAPVNVDEIHIMELMAAYWKRFLDSLPSSFPVNVLVLDSVCSGIGASILTAGLAQTQGLSQTIPTVGGILDVDWPDAVKRGLRLLVDQGVVVVDGEQIGPSQQFELIWGFLLARSSLALVGQASQSDWMETVRDLCDLIRLDVPAANSALRFIFLHEALSGDSLHGGSRLNLSTCWEILNDGDMPNEVVWQTAPSLSKQTQRALATGSLRQTPTPEDVFWILRFLRLLDPLPASGALAALDFASLTFPMLPKAGLADYVFQALRGLVTQIDWTSRHDANQGLYLMNEVGESSLSDVLAKLVLKQLRFDQQDQRYYWVRVLKSFMSRVAVPSRRNVHTPDPAVTRTFWTSICDHSMSALAAAAGPNYLVELINTGWYTDADPSRAEPVAFEMRRAAQVHFGHSFTDDPDAFRAIINGLLDNAYQPLSSYAQATAAIYGVYHSTSSGGRRSQVYVSPALKMEVERLRADPLVRRFHGSLLRRIYVSDGSGRLAGAAAE